MRTHRLRRDVTVVKDYIRRFRNKAAEELQFFQQQPSLEEAVELAALAQGPRGRFKHQRRIPAGVLQTAASILSQHVLRIQHCQSFEELIHLIDKLIRPTRGIGELMVYDTALRIGAKLNIYPNQVYLHAGTREGARALGIEPSLTKVSTSSLPKAFLRLQPHEIEDCLCIYKSHLSDY